jgi:N-acetylmuramoyl-L-alanine amidase
MDNRAMSRGRKEKEETLKLALDLGEALEQKGYEVDYTRTEDEYASPYEKSQMGNRMESDFFLYLHRNLGEEEEQKQGVSAYVFQTEGVAGQLAGQILSELENIGFQNLGVHVRQGLAVLRRTKMPALILELGYLNSETDNKLWDEKFEDIVQGIRNAFETVFSIEEELPMAQEESPANTEYAKEIFDFWVQTGVFRFYENALYQVETLRDGGYQTALIPIQAVYAVRVGPYEDVDQAAEVQNVLRDGGFETLVVSEKQS